MRLHHKCLFWVMCLAGAGCYSFTPVDVPSPGTDVRVRLTAEAAARRSQGLETPILFYDGKVVRSSEEAVAVDILVARGSSMFQPVEIRDTLSVPRAEIQSVLGRKLSVSKTVLVTIVAGAAAVGIVMGIDQVVGGTGDPGEEPPPAGALVPLLRWNLGRLLPSLGSGR